MPVCGNYLFFELPKKIVLNPKDGDDAGMLFACDYVICNEAPDDEAKEACAKLGAALA